MTTPNIDQFIAERNAALLSGDLTKVRAYMEKWGDGAGMSEQVLEIAMHKARTACVGLPLEARRKSKRWLAERGYRSADDGDLL